MPGTSTARSLRLLVAAIVGSGMLVVASSAAHGSVPRAGERCAVYQSLHDDLGDLELNQEFDADGYGRLADDYAAAAKDAPAELRTALKTSGKFYAKVARSRNEKAAIKLYLKGIKRYRAEFQALDDYLADSCGATPGTTG